jgi:hypothetical protein
MIWWSNCVPTHIRKSIWASPTHFYYNLETHSWKIRTKNLGVSGILVLRETRCFRNMWHPILGPHFFDGFINGGRALMPFLA